MNASQGETAVNCNDIFGNCLITPTVGVLGTPVIEIDQTSPTTTGTLYVVAHSECAATTQCAAGGNNTFFHRIHALPITSLADASYALICGSGCGTDSSSQFSHDHIQRPGLLWLSSAQSGQGHNEVYVAFSMMDGTTTNPNGWIWGYNAQNLSQTPLSYLTTPETNGQRGGFGKAQQDWPRVRIPRAGTPTFTSAPLTEISTSTLAVRMRPIA